MEVGIRAKSTANLWTPQTVPNGEGSKPPLRAQSTYNLSCRNRALSWSPARLDGGTPKVALPWARQSTIEEGAKRNSSSIDGSVAKARSVWEKVSDESKVSGGKMGGSASFRTPTNIRRKSPQRNSFCGIQSVFGGGSKSIFGDGSKPTASDGSKPNESNGSKETASDGSKPTASDGSKPSVSDGSKPNVSDGSKPTASDGSKPSASDGSKLSVSDGSKPTVSDGSKPAFMRNREASTLIDSDRNSFKRNGFVVNSSDEGNSEIKNKLSPFENSVQSSGGTKRAPREGIPENRIYDPPPTSENVNHHQNRQMNVYNETNNHSQKVKFPIHPNPNMVKPNNNIQDVRNDAGKSQSMPGYYNRAVNSNGLPQTSGNIYVKNHPTNQNNGPLSPVSPMSPHNIQQFQYSQVHPRQRNMVPPPFAQPNYNGQPNYTNGQPYRPVPLPRTQRPQEPLPPSVTTPKSERQSKAPLTKSPDDKKSKKSSSFLGFLKKPKSKKAEAAGSSNSDNEQNGGSKDKEKQNEIKQTTSQATWQVNNSNQLLQNSRNVTSVPGNNNQVPSGQPLGIPLLSSPQGKLVKKTVHTSHDSLPVNNSQNYNNSLPNYQKKYNSSMYNRCMSTESVSRKEKREALKSRVETLRTKYAESSSEEDKKSHSSQCSYDSANSFTRNGSLTKRSRAARTERYLRRKSYELETLKKETQKDKKSKEAVQARIQEIQRVQQNETDRNNVNSRPSISEANGRKPVWKADLVYQESTREVSPIILSTPLSPPYAQYMKDTRCSSASLNAGYVNSRHTYSPVTTTYGVSVVENTVPYTRANMNDMLSPGNLKSNRSVSFDCNINKSNGKNVNTPPAPPPRDQSRLISPVDPQRPFSYSFENLSQSQQIEKMNNKNAPNNLTTSQGIRAVLSQSQTRLNSNQNGKRNSKRYSSDLQLSPTKTDLPPFSPTVPLLNVSFDQSDLQNHHSPVSRPGLQIPPSPSSDYSSYVSDNSARLTQVNDAWKQKEQMLKKYSYPKGNDSIMSGESSRSSTPKSSARDMLKANHLKTDSLSSHSCPSENHSPIGRIQSPDPPVRSSKAIHMSGLEKAKREMQMILEQERKLQRTKAEKKRQFEEAYMRERKKLERARCANLEEALLELEMIYKGLKLEDDFPQNNDIEELLQDANNLSLIYDSMKKPTETHSLDIKKDDMHNRRCRANDKKSNDLQHKIVSGQTYLDIPQVQIATSDIEVGQLRDKQRPASNEPDILYDDASLRNIQRANAIKVIDPQPPFGIPIGPTTQGSPNDYLHVTKDVPDTSGEVPDPALDDLAFRNLRRDQRNTQRKLKQNFNGPFRHPRSHSADRSGNRSTGVTQVNTCEQSKLTPRQVKHQNEAKKVAMMSENASSTTLRALRSNRNNPSWLEQAHLDDPAITNLCSTRAISQPDIRVAILKESKDPTGGPEDWKDGNPFRTPENNIFTASTEDLTAPRLVKIQNLSTTPTTNNQGFITKKLYRPLDKIYNTKPKPFYKSDSMTSLNSPSTESEAIGLVSNNTSTITQVDNKVNTYSRVYAPTGINKSDIKQNSATTEECTISQNTINATKDSPKTTITNSEDSNVSAFQKYEVRGAKTSIMNAIRFSMALDTTPGEGNKLTNKKNIDDSVEHVAESESPLVCPSDSANVKSTISPSRKACKEETVPISSPNSNISNNHDKHIPKKYINKRVNEVQSFKTSSSAIEASTKTYNVKRMVVQSESVDSYGKKTQSLPTVKPFKFGQSNEENNSDLLNNETPADRITVTRTISHQDQIIKNLLDVSLDEDQMGKVILAINADRKEMINEEASKSPQNYSLEDCVRELSSGIGVLRSTMCSLDETHVDQTKQTTVESKVETETASLKETNEDNLSPDSHINLLTVEEQQQASPSPSSSTMRLDDSEFSNIIKDYEKEAADQEVEGFFSDTLQDDTDVEEDLNEVIEENISSQYESLEEINSSSDGLHDELDLKSIEKDSLVVENEKIPTPDSDEISGSTEKDDFENCSDFEYKYIVKEEESEEDNSAVKKSNLPEVTEEVLELEIVEIISETELETEEEIHENSNESDSTEATSPTTNEILELSTKVVLNDSVENKVDDIDTASNEENTGLMEKEESSAQSYNSDDNHCTEDSRSVSENESSSTNQQKVKTRW